nr:hypothetical protein [Fodinibius sp.]NIV15334.1 hypothetical protein [Fodinibius sp.]NIY29203.1 hypothetical protein [Fodinibius sp.]
TCEPVPIFAYGPHGLLFTGVHDNTEIAKIFARVMKLEDFPQKLQDSL